MSALDRARGWLIAPPPPATSDWSAPPADLAAPPADAAPGLRATGAAPAPVPPLSAVVPAAPVGGPARPEQRVTPRTAATIRGYLAPSPAVVDGTVAAPRPPAEVVAAAPEPAAADRPARSRRRKRPPRPAGDLGPDAPPRRDEWADAPRKAIAAVTSAAVVGRPGEAEPVAAALALALRIQTRAKAAAVAVVGALPPEVEGASANAAARRLAARLGDHGLDARARGRLAWVALDSADLGFAATARRVTLVAAPAVFAVTAARSAAVDATLQEQDLLVIVAAEPEGALAQLAGTGLSGVPVHTVRPLGRGPARALARAGLRAAKPLRVLLTTVSEEAR